MSKLNKTRSGLLFYDDFSERTLLWQLSPSNADCLRFGEDGLRMLHGRRYVTFTLPEPDIDEYSCIVEIDHEPANAEDIAGIIVLSNNRDYVECQTFLATSPSELENSKPIDENIRRIVREEMNVAAGVPDTNVGSISGSETSEEFQDINYRFIKFTKQKHKYTFWASEDTKKWIEVGTVKFDDSGSIGFFIYGTKNDEILDNSHCYIKNMAIYDGRYITVDGISRKYEFEMYNKDGRTLMRTDSIAYYSIMSRSNTRTVINTVNMPMPISDCTFRIFPHGSYETTIQRFDLDADIYGGDNFHLEHDIRFFIGQQQILTEGLCDLGTFFRGNYFIKASILNNEDYSVYDVKVRITAYSEYYSGEQEVYLALSDDGIPESELEYKKELIIPEIQASESKNIYIKLLEQPEQGFYMTANDYRFKIMIE